MQPIVTKHNLNLTARYQILNAPKLDRWFVTGTQAKTAAAENVKQWNEQGNAVEPEFIHSGSADRFIFDAPLEDLAKQEDVLTAKYGAKRLEYCATYLNFEGKPFSLEAFGIPLLLSLVALLAAFYIDRWFIMKKRTPKANTQAR